MTDLPDAALRYAKEGWHVFPLSPGTKVPMAGSGGNLDATTELAQVAQWWADSPHANIGIATEPSGLAVLDLDTYKGDAAGAWMKSVTLPETLTFRTGRGGLQMVYRGEIPSTTSALAKDVDTRGTGGYIVAPPSSVPQGQYKVEHLANVADLPAWVAQELANRSSNGSAPDLDIPSAATTPWGQGALDGEVSKLLSVQQGGRNHAMFRGACNLFEAVKGGHLNWEDTIQTLRRVGRLMDDNPSDPFPPGEVEDILKQAWRRTEARGPSHKPRFLSMEDMQNMKPPEWLIPNFLPEGLTFLYGQRGTGKSFVAIDSSLALASQGRHVVYCAGEGAGGIGIRLKAWQEAHPEHPVDDRVHWLVLENFPQLNDDEKVEKLNRDLQSLETPPDLIVIDTWNLAINGSENNPEDVTPSVMTLKELMGNYGANILVLHHPNRPQGGIERMRGSGVPEESADCLWHATWDQEGTRRTLWNEKTKDFEPLPPMNYVLKPSGPSVAPDPSMVELM